MPRTKLHTTPEAKAKARAEAQAKYRARNEVLVTAALDFKEAVTLAADRGACPRLVDDLPDEPTAMLQELTRRLDAYKLCAFRRLDV